MQDKPVLYTTPQEAEPRLSRDEFDELTETDREPTDNEIYNRPGVEGGIGYPLFGDVPGSLGENDWRL